MHILMGSITRESFGYMLVTNRDCIKPFAPLTLIIKENVDCA